MILDWNEEEGRAAALRCLERIAIDPRPQPGAVGNPQFIDSGDCRTILCRFYQNAVTILASGDRAGLQPLVDAMDANMAGPLFEAAKRHEETILPRLARLEKRARRHYERLNRAHLESLGLIADRNRDWFRARREEFFTVRLPRLERCLDRIRVLNGRFMEATGAHGSWYEIVERLGVSA